MTYDYFNNGYDKSGDVFIFIKDRSIFFSFLEEDRKKLHDLFGGKQYYQSCSGKAGAGYFLSPSNDLIIKTTSNNRNFLGFDEIFFFSNWWENGDDCIVGKVGGEVLFFEGANPFIEFILLSKGEPKSLDEYLDEKRQAEYFYLNSNGIQKKFLINYYLISELGEKKGKPRSNSKEKRNSFESIIQKMEIFPKIEETLETETINTFLHHKMYLKNSKFGLVRMGFFDLPVEIIKTKIFSEEKDFCFSNGWVSQGFGPFCLGYKKVSKQEKVYAILEVVPSRIKKCYSILGGEPQEYELVENALEWFSKPFEYWVEKMKGELLKKIRSEFLNLARWDKGQQIGKVKELLSENPETIFTLQDSLNAGNCRPGTESWMAGFGIKEPMASKQLFEDKKFEEMLQNSRFRAVVINKLFLPEEE